MKSISYFLGTMLVATSICFSNCACSSNKEEQVYIDNQLRRIERLQDDFTRAQQRDASYYELKRISDEAWQIKESLENMNLTPEQRQRLSNMFAI